MGLYLLSYLLVFRSFYQSLWIVPSAPITIGVTAAFMFHDYFLFSSKINLFFYRFTFFQFIMWSVKTLKSTIWQGFFVVYY